MKVLTDFVVIIRDLYGCTVISLIDILINIFYSLYRGADLDINMGPILYAKIRIIRYYIAVIKVYSSTITT